MKRITNIDTLSALFDRLITENIKLYFFKKEGLEENVEHQNFIIKEIKSRISMLMKEVLKKGGYDYIGEKRTFAIETIKEELEDLIKNDINIGEADRARLKEAVSENPNYNKLVTNEKRLRKANEGRAKNKNKIDEAFKFIFEKGKSNE